MSASIDPPSFGLARKDYPNASPPAESARGSLGPHQPQNQAEFSSPCQASTCDLTTLNAQQVSMQVDPPEGKPLIVTASPPKIYHPHSSGGSSGSSTHLPGICSDLSTFSPHSNQVFRAATVFDMQDLPHKQPIALVRPAEIMNNTPDVVIPSDPGSRISPDTSTILSRPEALSNERESSIVIQSQCSQPGHESVDMINLTSITSHQLHSPDDGFASQVGQSIPPQDCQPFIPQSTYPTSTTKLCSSAQVGTCFQAQQSGELTATNHSCDPPSPDQMSPEPTKVSLLSGPETAESVKCRRPNPKKLLDFSKIVYLAPGTTSIGAVPMPSPFQSDESIEDSLLDLKTGIPTSKERRRNRGVLPVIARFPSDVISSSIPSARPQTQRIGSQNLIPKSTPRTRWLSPPALLSSRSSSASELPYESRLLAPGSGQPLGNSQLNYWSQKRSEMTIGELSQSKQLSSPPSSSIFSNSDRVSSESSIPMQIKSHLQWMKDIKGVSLQDVIRIQQEGVFPVDYPQPGSSFKSLKEFKGACLVASFLRGHDMHVRVRNKSRGRDRYTYACRRDRKPPQGDGCPFQIVVIGNESARLEDQKWEVISGRYAHQNHSFQPGDFDPRQRKRHLRGKQAKTAKEIQMFDLEPESIDSVESIQASSREEGKESFPNDIISLSDDEARVKADDSDEYFKDGNAVISRTCANLNAAQRSQSTPKTISEPSASSIQPKQQPAGFSSDSFSRLKQTSITDMLANPNHKSTLKRRPSNLNPSSSQHPTPSSSTSDSKKPKIEHLRTRSHASSTYNQQTSH